MTPRLGYHVSFKYYVMCRCQWPRRDGDSVSGHVLGFIGSLRLVSVASEPGLLSRLLVGPGHGSCTTRGLG